MVSQASGHMPLAVGSEVGEFRVTEIGPDRLVLSSAPLVPVIFLVAGAAAAVACAVLLVRGSTGPASTFAAIAIGGVGASLRFLGFSYTIDRASGSVTRRRPWSNMSWAKTDLKGICLAVAPVGSFETLRLELTKGDSTTVQLACRVTNAKEAIHVAAAGHVVAAILDLPLLRSGESRLASPELRLAFEGGYAVPSHGDNADLHINCPHCHARNVAAVAHVLRERHGLTWTTDWVRCSSCGTDLYSKLPVEDIATMSAEELESVLVYRTSFLARLLAIMAIALGVVPVVGVVVGILSLVVNYRRGGWMRGCSIAGIVLSLIVTTLAFLLN